MKKPAKPFVPVPAGTQRRQHQRQLARMKQWRPLTFSAQRQAHRAAQQKAVAHQHHATKVKKATKARGWSPDGDVALCSARAVAEHLRLVTGLRVADADVLALHRAAGGDDERGASILDVLSAAELYGLAGRKLASMRAPKFPAAPDYPLIAGLRLSGGELHSVVYDGEVCWSWGEPFDPLEWPELVVEEVWAVQWLP